MESHVLNTYHQARYRTIGHKRMGSTSESLSSESSCNQNSPEYQQAQPVDYVERNGYEGNEEYWDLNQTANTTQTSQDSSSDEEEHVEVVDVDNSQLLDAEDTLVEGDDYDVIQVYAVHPDLDLEASSDEDQPDYVNEEAETSDEGEYYETPNYSEDTQYEYQESKSDISQVGLGINLDGPVVSNVDEYFIKDTIPKPILDVKDEPVVNDVDEYFIKEVKPVPEAIEVPEIPNIDDFFIKQKVPEEPKMQLDNVLKVQESLPKNEVLVEPEQNNEHDPIAEVSINESDLEVLPNIEDIKRYLLEDMTCTKFKHAQRSCSVPHSPLHHLSLDIDDAKTCLSFEDLNLDLSDLAFDNDKDKSDSHNKSYDIPRTLTDEDVNSFLITSKTESQNIEKNDDDLSHQDMEIEHPVETSINCINQEPPRTRTSTPIPKPTVLDFCIEKPVKSESVVDIKAETDDFVDVESCNDTVIPVLAANNLNSLLEQFEANETFATKPKRPVIKEEAKVKTNGLTNGMRLQDAGVQLNKHKMRQILMPPAKNTALRRSPSPVHSDHDYCSTKKRHSLPALKGGQSLLKPEVLSSNSRILSSRHRSCKNKKIVYHLSSDDENDKCDKKIKPINRSSDDSDIKIKKSTLKQPIKPPTPSNCRKKLSPVHSAIDTCKDKINNSVMVKNASKASDTLCSQTNSSIKLTIKNKSEVILNCDENYRQDVKEEKCISSVSDKTLNNGTKTVKSIQELVSIENKSVNTSDNNCTKVGVKEESRPKEENFYTALFSNKQDVQIPQTIDVKKEKRQMDDEVKTAIETTNKIEVEQPLKKKKLNLQEYKLRRSVTSNNSSAAVSPEAIFPDLPNPGILEKVVSNNPTNPTISNGTANDTIEQKNLETPTKIFDPIREASRKILMHTKKQKAEAMRKRDEDIVMSKIPKVENLELQPLISDAEMLKIVGGMTPAEIPVPMQSEKPRSTDYEEMILVSVGTNTDEKIFKQIEKSIQREERQSLSPPVDAKAMINFKIKKSDHVLKQNVFDGNKKERRSPDDKRTDIKIDKERYKDITAALKSVEKQVDTISSNSLFASIQDVVMKKAPEEEVVYESEHQPSPRQATFTKIKTTIVRDYDTKADHGEDKIILHLGKHRRKPVSTNVAAQTDIIAIEASVEPQQAKRIPTKERSPVQRKRNDSDMSMSSEASPVRSDKSGSVGSPVKSKEAQRDSQKRSRSVEKRSRSNEKRSRSKEKRSRSRDRYDRYRRRSRSRSRRRRRSRSRSVRARRSRSTDRYRRRRQSPYKRKRTRSPYRRRSPSIRRDYRSNRTRSRSRSRHDSTRSKSPIKKTPPRMEKCDKSFTPPLRKSTISESSDSSTSSSSSSSSSSSDQSRHTPRSCSPRRDDYRRKAYRSFSPEDRESNKPVEERRIVFVGKLEKDSNKASLRGHFCKFGHIIEVRLHNKEDGTRYGFVTFQRARDAWSAVEAAGQFPQYDVGFGGRRAFCRQSYADLDGLEAEYTESSFHGPPSAPPRCNDMSFEQMLQDMKNKLNQRKNEKHADKP